MLTCAYNMLSTLIVITSTASTRPMVFVLLFLIPDPKGFHRELVYNKLLLSQNPCFFDLIGNP